MEIKVNSSTNEYWITILCGYFESHIKQRFLLLNYFIIILSFLVIAAYYSHKICESFWGQNIVLIALGIIMSSVAFVFYIFEKRVKFLIDRCCKRLAILESKISLERDLILFENEETETNEEKKTVKLWGISCGYFFSYSKCINALILISWVAYLAILLSISIFINSGCH